MCCILIMKKITIGQREKLNKETLLREICAEVEKERLRKKVEKVRKRTFIICCCVDVIAVAWIVSSCEQGVLLACILAVLTVHAVGNEIVK